jgi:hypothetical protein
LSHNLVALAERGQIMTAKVNQLQVSQFVLGMLISLTLSSIAAMLGFGAAIFMYFAMPGNPFVLPAIILIPTVIAITFKLVKANGAQALGAVAYYPCAALALYIAYGLTIGAGKAAEREAARHDYSSRTIAQPLGTIDVLGIPLAHRCIDTCARILLNGIANEVAGISYDKKINLHDATSYAGTSAPWIFRRYRLGRGAECLAEPTIAEGRGSMSWTGADVQWIQGYGIYDVCILMTVGGPELGNMILVDHGPKAWRPHGPRFGPVDGAAVASRIADGQRSEIARWEFGIFERTGRTAPGARFSLLDFVKALSGNGEPDRLANAHDIGFRAALDRISASLDTMPNIDGWAPFGFLRMVHEKEMGRGTRRGAPDPSERARLRELAARICPAQKRMFPKACFERYNDDVGAIFTPEAAANLRWPTGP